MKDRCEIVINQKSKMRKVFFTLLAALIGVAQMNAQTIVDIWQIGTPNKENVIATLYDVGVGKKSVRQNS